MIAKFIMQFSCRAIPRLAINHERSRRDHNRVNFGDGFSRFRSCARERLDENAVRERRTGNGPRRKVGHPWRSRKTDMRQPPQAAGNAIQQRAEDLRAISFEMIPDFNFRSALFRINPLHRDNHRSVGKIGTIDRIL